MLHLFIPRHRGNGAALVEIRSSRTEDLRGADVSFDVHNKDLRTTSCCYEVGFEWVELNRLDWSLEEVLLVTDTTHVGLDLTLSVVLFPIGDYVVGVPDC